MINTTIYTYKAEGNSRGTELKSDAENYTISTNSSFSRPETLTIKGTGTHKKGIEFIENLEIILDVKAVKKIIQTAIEEGMIQIADLISAEKLNDLIQSQKELAQIQKKLQGVIKEIEDLHNPASIVVGQNTKYTFGDSILESFLAQPIPHGRLYFGDFADAFFDSSGLSRIRNASQPFAEFPQQAKELIKGLWETIIILEYHNRDSFSFLENYRAQFESLLIDTPKGKRQIYKGEVNKILKFFSDEAKKLVLQAKSAENQSIQN
jgi:hypothetical protein